jgi:hypothetical protein
MSAYRMLINSFFRRRGQLKPRPGLFIYLTTAAPQPPSGYIAIVSQPPFCFYLDHHLKTHLRQLYTPKPRPVLFIHLTNPAILLLYRGGPLFEFLLDQNLKPLLIYALGIDG